MRKQIVSFLIYCLVLMPAWHGSAGTFVHAEVRYGNPQKSDSRSKQEADIKAKAELLGLGADIKVVARRNSRGELIVYRGIIEDLSSDELKLQIRNETQPIDYDKIRKLNFYTDKYKTEGIVDPVAVRRVVVELGIGQKAKLMLHSDQRIKGSIQSIASDSFTINDLKTGQGKTISFAEVTAIQKEKFPGWATGLIVGGAATLGVLIWLFVALD